MTLPFTNNHALNEKRRRADFAIVGATGAAPVPFAAPRRSGEPHDLNGRGGAKHAVRGGAFSSSEFSLYADVFSYLNSKLSLPNSYCRP